MKTKTYGINFLVASCLRLETFIRKQLLIKKFNRDYPLGVGVPMALSGLPFQITLTLWQILEVEGSCFVL